MKDLLIMFIVYSISVAAFVFLTGLIGRCFFVLTSEDRNLKNVDRNLMKWPLLAWIISSIFNGSLLTWLLFTGGYLF